VKELRPRNNFYSLGFESPTSNKCINKQTDNYDIMLTSPDRMEPLLMSDPGAGTFETVKVVHVVSRA